MPYFPAVDPERQWLFRLEFSLPTLPTGSTEILTINAQQVSIPSYEFQSIIIPHLNMDVKFAGRPSLGNMTVLFLNAYNKDAVNVLELWHNEIYQPDTETFGFAANYKANCDLLIFRPDNSEHKHYKVLGTFPLSIGTRDYDSI